MLSLRLYEGVPPGDVTDSVSEYGRNAFSYTSASEVIQRMNSKDPMGSEPGLRTLAAPLSATRA